MGLDERPTSSCISRMMHMKISPEPLHPLRSWRELWQSEAGFAGTGFRNRTSSQTDHWKQPKRAGFQWFNNLFSRETSK